MNMNMRLFQQVKVTSTKYSGQLFQEYTDEIVVVERHSHSDHDIVVIPISRRNVLVPKVRVHSFLIL